MSCAVSGYRVAQRRPQPLRVGEMEISVHTQQVVVFAVSLTTLSRPALKSVEGVDDNEESEKRGGPPKARKGKRNSWSAE